MRRLGMVVVSVALAVWGSGLASTPGAAATTGVSVQIDAGQLLSPIPAGVPGVVMQVASPTTPPELATAIGLRSGRYSAYWHAHMAGNMPVCWDTDDPTRFDDLDEDLGKGTGDGLDMGLTHLQLGFVSPCDLAPEAEPVLTQPVGNQGFQPTNPQYPSASMLAAVTHPERVQAMLEDQIRHVAGVLDVTQFTVWNEPDGLYPVAPDVYLRYWDLAYEALTTIEAELGRDLQIGGPVAAFAGSPYIKLLLDHVVAEGQTIDAVVYHGYADKGGAGSSAAYVAEYAEVRRLVDDAMATAPWLDPDIWINEWGIDASSVDSDGRDSAGAAFVVSTLTTYADMGLDAAHFYSYQDDKGERNGDNDVLLYGLLDDQDQPRPSWHAFRMFHELGTRRVAATPVHASLGGRQEWGAVATLGDDGRLRVLLRNSDPADAGVDLDVVLDIAGFATASWSAQDLGTDTGDTVVTTSGLGIPTVSLPPNHVTLLTLEPGVVGGTTGWVGPSASAPDIDAGHGDGWETDTTLAYTDGSGAAVNLAGVGDAHVFSDFAGTVPAGATIESVDVRADWWVSAANWSPQLEISVSGDGGQSWSPVVVTATGGTAERSDAIVAALGPGLADPEEVAVRIASRCTAGLCASINWSLDWVAVRINSTTPA